MNIDILGSPALSLHYTSQVTGCKVRWMAPATRHWPQSIRNWGRLREVLSISRPSPGPGGGAAPWGEGADSFI